MIKNFKGKENTNGFKSNKMNINKKGRPRKAFSSINSSFKELDIEPVTKSQYNEFISYVFNMTIIDIQKLRKESDIPFAMKLILNHITNKKTGLSVLNDFRDYVFGKHDPIQQDNNHITININLSDEDETSDDIL